MMFFDGTNILLLPALLLSLYAQHKVKSTFNHFSSMPSRRGLSGAEAAYRLLRATGLYDVKIEHVPGNLIDHYDPRSKTVRLSDSVYSRTSLAAIGVAAHEVGHALQHRTGYVPLAWRTGIFPLVSIASKLAMPLLMLGLILSAGSGEFGMTMLYTGIILFSATVLFQIITLPIEFNASKRAIQLLQEQGILSTNETLPARKVLDAAALTYVAVAITAVLNLVRFLLIANSRRSY